MKAVYFPIYLVVTLLMLAACGNDGRESLRERADIESQQAAANQIAEENSNLMARAKVMEADLARRQRFYQNVAGEYSGKFRVDTEDNFVRIKLSPTVYPIQSDRVRSIEEISKDLSELAFDVHVVQWSAEYPNTGWGCTAENIRAHLEEGRVEVVVQEECTFTYSLSVATPGATPAGLSLENQVAHFFSGQGKILAQALLDGKTADVKQVVGVIRPTMRPTRMFFKADRLN